MPNRTLRILFACNAVFVFAGSLLGPLYTVFVQGIDNRIMAISGSWAVFLLSTTLCMFLLTRLRDKGLHKKYLLTGSYLLRAVIWSLFPMVHGLAFLLILQAILGLGEAMGSPTFDAIFAEHLDPGEHVADYSEWQVIQNLVLAGATFTGGLVVSSFGFPVLFYGMSVLAVAAGAGAYLNLRRV